MINVYIVIYIVT